MEPEELPGVPDPEVEQEHSRLLGRVDALVEISRKERERLEKPERQAPVDENLTPEL